jgi:hypothetical protein
MKKQNGIDKELAQFEEDGLEVTPSPPPPPFSSEIKNTASFSPPIMPPRPTKKTTKRAQITPNRSNNKKKRILTVTPVNGLEDYDQKLESDDDENENYDNKTKCELCSGVQKDGLLICAICNIGAVHETCMGKIDRDIHSDTKWQCIQCRN